MIPELFAKADVNIIVRWGHGWLGLTGWGMFIVGLLVLALFIRGDN